MVSGTMALSQATMKGGKAGISAQRGTDTWGANYVFNPSGLQNDVLVISDVFQNLSTSGAYATDAELLAVSGAITASGEVFNQPKIASGTFVTQFIPTVSGAASIGSANYPLASGGIIMCGPGGAAYKFVILAGGLISGIAL